jgi:hypothetical protein
VVDDPDLVQAVDAEEDLVELGVVVDAVDVGPVQAGIAGVEVDQLRVIPSARTVGYGFRCRMALRRAPLPGKQ